MTENSRIPQWSNKVIGYQCFVDSFAIGDTSISEKAGLYPNDVYGRPTRLLDWSEEFPEYGYGFYGGDLKGIIQSVHHYLADFGVDMLYLTPVFKGVSNHKYDITDYMSIDPQFGDSEVFAELVRACHDSQMKIILDGVFNHTSSHHYWYLKALEGQAPFRDYYKKNEDGHFLKWNGVETLPFLNHAHPDIQKYLYDGEDSVVKHWLQQGADGWRLDAAERLGKEVIRRIKKSIREEFADKILYHGCNLKREWAAVRLLNF